jgi:hypothetical protein
MAIDGWFYIEIRKGMYGLKQEGLLANQLFQKRLAHFGYYPACHTSVIWLHKTSLLIVDDFTVKYVGKENIEHLRNTLLSSYELAIDLGGTLYSDMTLNWDYQKRTCTMSMSGCVANVLSKFQHDNPNINNTHLPYTSHPCIALRHITPLGRKYLP